MADLTVSKTEAIASAESARRALRGLRASMRETTNAVVDASLSVAGAAGAGYARATYGQDYELLGYDASLVAGAAGLALALYQGGTTGERMMAASVGVLCEYAARAGAEYASSETPAVQGGSAADYLRAYAGQVPGHV